MLMVTRLKKTLTFSSNETFPLQFIEKFNEVKAMEEQRVQDQDLKQEKKEED